MENIASMTEYEIISTTISIIALTLSILIPLLQWIWRKWIVKAKVKYYSTGQATLFFNKDGSYIQINGIVESEGKTTTIKKIKIIVTRKRDDLKLNLTWSHSVSPVSQSILGNYVQTTELSHPFRVEADNFACAFVVYSDIFNSSGIKIRNICANLINETQEIYQEINYNQALNRLLTSASYINAKGQITNECFWETGKYAVDIIVEYGEQDVKSFPYEFYISEQNYFELQKNIDEILITQLKINYRVNSYFYAPQIEIRERKTDKA